MVVEYHFFVFFEIYNLYIFLIVDFLISELLRGKTKTYYLGFNFFNGIFNLRGIERKNRKNLQPSGEKSLPICRL